MDDITDVVVSLIRRNGSLRDKILTYFVKLKFYNSHSLDDFEKNMKQISDAGVNAYILVDNVTYEGFRTYQKGGPVSAIYGSKVAEGYEVNLSGRESNKWFKAVDDYRILTQIQEKLHEGQKNLTAIIKHSSYGFSLVQFDLSPGALRAQPETQLAALVPQFAY